MPEPLAPRTRLFAAILKRVAAEADSSATMVALRERREAVRTTALGRAIFGRIPAGVETSELRLPDGLRAVLYRPTALVGPLPVVVNYHGGGWCLGTPEQSGWLSAHIALQVGAIVVAPAYRLAPEHPYPAAADDAWTALSWLVENPPTDAAIDRLAVMGDSAGGNLAAVSALKARDAGAPALRAQVLVYPAVEMYERYPSEEEFAEAPVLTSAGMRRFGHLYLGEGYGTEDWQASPLRAPSHAGLPPALILTAGHDPLRDHGSRYADALREAGVEVDLRDYGAAIHGFMSLPGVVPVAKRALADTVGFLRDRL